MATTTATVSVFSNDLQPGNSLSINASSTLMKTGLTTGMDIVRMGKNTLATADNAKVLHEGGVDADDRDQACFTYLCNNATDDTYYLLVTINATLIGRLYAGDWMWMPYSQGDNAAELNIQAQGGTCPYEYAIFSTVETPLDET